MSRLRQAFLSGTVTDNPLTNSATTINSAEFANLPAVASPNILALVLDPAGGDGAPEVVHVTAHTASATSATVVRAREGTSAREHIATTPWVHGPTIHDFGERKATSTIASASELVIPNTDEDYFEVTGTTTIDTITPVREAGRIIRLRFQNRLTLSLMHGGSTTANEISGGNYSSSGLGTDASIFSYDILTTPNQVYELISEGTYWRLLDSMAREHRVSTTGSAVTLSSAGTYFDSWDIVLPPGYFLLIAEAEFVVNTTAILTLAVRVSTTDQIRQDMYCVSTNTVRLSVCRYVSHASDTTYKISGKSSAGTNNTVLGTRLSAYKLNQ